MREIVKVQAASNGKLTIAIPKEIRSAITLKAGDKMIVALRGREVVLTVERNGAAVKAREEKRGRK